MRVIYFICFYILIAISLMQNLLPFTVVLGVTFSMYFGAVWLIPLAVLTDAYFGAFGSIPVFSLIAITWYGTFEFLRPYLRMRVIN